MTDLADRVLAAIEETERVARDKFHFPQRLEPSYCPVCGATVKSLVIGTSPQVLIPCRDEVSQDQMIDAGIMARSEPDAAVLRRCAADRKIVERCLSGGELLDRMIEHLARGGVLRHNERAVADVRANLAREVLVLIARGYGITEEES